MKQGIRQSETESGKLYAVAYESHYTTKDLHKALRLYRDIINEFPNMPEAAYALTQIQNIVNSVVPQQVLLDAQIELVLTCISHEEPPSAEQD